MFLDTPLLSIEMPTRKHQFANKNPGARAVYSTRYAHETKFAHNIKTMSSPLKL